MVDETFFLYVAGAIVLLIILWLASWQRPASIAELRSTVAILVQAAEQMMPGEDGAEKLDWVLDRANALGITKHVDATLLRAMIESAVYWLSKGQH